MPVSKAEFDEINAGLKREGIEPIDTGAGVTAPPWSTPILIEVPPGSAEFEAILASLSEEDRAAVRPQQAPRGNGHDRQDAHQGRDQRGTGGNDDSDNDDDAVIRNYQRGEERTGAPAVYYVYYDEQGGLHQRKIRSTTKKFWQEIWKDGCWAKGAPQIKYLYGMRELLAAAPDVPIWITEGEKDRDTLAGLDLVAVTNPGGAGKWNKDFTSAQIERWFKGRKTVYLLEDNDAPGRKHVEIIGRTLQSLVADIRVVTFRELAEKSDVTDWLVEHKHTKEELLARAAAAPKYRPPALQSVNAADVTMVAVDWLWPNRFALGKLGIIAGLPDEGKGLLLSYIAAQVTNGGAWPLNEGRAACGNVLLLSAEDDPNDTVVPRLAAAGADLSRIEIIKMVREAGVDRMFSLQTDLVMLQQKIAEIGNVALVLIDPISAYLGVGKMDSYRTTDVRAVLGPVVNLATELKLAIIGIMHFNKKLDVTNALLRISDSLAYGATARHVYGVINDAENNRKLVVRAKNNLALNTAAQTTLGFSFGVREVATDPNSGKPIMAPYVVWEAQYVDVTATEAMQAASESKSPGERDKAKNLLFALLAGGREVFVDEIKDTAEGHGLAWRTMRRAAEDLKVIISKEHGTPRGKWIWKLPPQEEAPAPFLRAKVPL